MQYTQDYDERLTPFDPDGTLTNTVKVMPYVKWLKQTVVETDLSNNKAIMFCQVP